MEKLEKVSRKAGAAQDAGPPLYQMVVQALRAEILRGAYPVGSALPSELALVTRFGVSRHTVREAIRHLRDLGLVESHQGKGTLILKPGGPQVYVHQVNSIGDLHDYSVESRYADHADAVSVDPALAERMGVEPGDQWLRIDGMRFDEGQPICAVEIYVATEFAGISRLLGRRSGPIYALIEDVYGEAITEVTQDLRALPVPEEVARRLEIEPGETVVEIKRTYRLLDGRPAEITFNYYKAANFRFAMNLRRVRNPG
ncbi:GntR family transcriptional regulator [Tsuneonella sp. HG222]